MIVRLMIVAVMFGCVAPVFAADNLFNSMAEIKKEAGIVGDEAVDVVTSPFELNYKGLVTTLAVAGAVGITYAFDYNIRDKVQGLKRNSTLDNVTDFSSNVVGNPLVHIGIAAAVYGCGIYADSALWKETGLMLGEAALLADAGALILKQAVGRGRPDVTRDKNNFKPFQFKTDYDSFPSMHTASAFAMASVMSSTSESIYTKLLYYSAATFVGFSRIYQDKHWASDVLMGAALGELCGRVVIQHHSEPKSIAFMPMVANGTIGVTMLKEW